MKQKKYILSFFSSLALLILLMPVFCLAQNTTTVQTFTFPNQARSGVFSFPNDPAKTYEKIMMQYRMRCKGGLISTSTNRNLGCGEWDYSCNTYLTDSAKTDSLKALHPTFIISNGAVGVFEFTNASTYFYREYIQKRVLGSSSNEMTTPVSSGTAITVRPFGGNTSQSKTQFLWKASELTAAGLSAGNLNGINFNVQQAGGIVQFLRLKLKATTKTELTSIEDSTGFSQVYFLNTALSATGTQRFNFNKSFAWDGTSNLILEVSYNNTPTSNARLSGGAPPFNAALANTTDDGYLAFNGAEGHIDCGDIDALDNAQKFTYEGWVYLKEWKPWTNLFDDNGKTLMQVGGTLGEIYCFVRNPSNSFGYATLVLPERVWTHVAMVFDGTQTGNNRLKLYVNGVQKTLNYTGSALPATTENNNTPTRIGQGSNCFIDDARIWSTSLDATTINTWMRQPVAATHPQFASLQAAYDLNETTGSLALDASSFNRTGSIKSSTRRGVFKGNEILKNLAIINERPNISFIKSNYGFTTQNVTVRDSILNGKQTITQYELQSGQPVAIDTTYQYAAIQQPVYDENGAVVTTIPTAIDSTIIIEDLNYFAKTPQKFELMSFVTPYGIGLDLGATGKMWEFDVTDFAPVLKGNKYLNIERGGENQEELDISFVFTEGTPPRNVLGIQQVWPVIQANYTDINANKYYEPRSITPQPNFATAKLRTAITGHGQEGEFTSRTHFINLNGGSNEFTINLTKECSLNPVFPQGGTWVYDRMGWCPGMPTDLREYNVTQYLQPNVAATFDYGVQSAAGDSRYIVSQQLVQYGAANFTLDAAVAEIKKPTDATAQSKRNPACMNPIVRITNTGSTTLTSLTISSGLVGEAHTSFQWTGNLPFMASQDVVLNTPELGNVAGVFEVAISSPNGGTDQYAANNYSRSAYNPPFIVPYNIVIELKSNSSPTQNSFVVKNAAGTVIKSRSTPALNTIYRDTLNLTNGCYEFILTDTGGDGLSWWANSSQGSGYLRFKNAATGALLKSFNPDFGGETYLQFSPGSNVATETPLKADNDVLQVFPNPASDKLTIDIALAQKTNAVLDITDLSGRLIETQILNELQQKTLEIDLRQFPKGMYFAVLKSANATKTVKFVVQ